VAYIPYEAIVRAFAAVGINASFGEDTEEAEFCRKVRQFQALTPAQLTRLKKRLLPPPPSKGQAAAAGPPPMHTFLAALEASLSRGVQGLTVVVLHGQARQLSTAAEAIAYLENYPEDQGSASPAAR
jgi:hypothetical protein